MNIVLAPHLDDEIIGCYSIWNKVDKVIYFTKDYREELILKLMKNYKKYIPEYIFVENFDFKTIHKEDTIYLPSKYDFHPLHKVVRNTYIDFSCKKMFYSVEMNVPWLEEETHPKGKLEFLKLFYPKENLFITNAKYYLFKSIKPFDDIIFANIMVDGVLIRLQIFDEDEDLTPYIPVLSIHSSINLEKLKNHIQKLFQNRIIQIQTNKISIE